MLSEDVIFIAKKICEEIIKGEKVGEAFNIDFATTMGLNENIAKINGIFRVEYQNKNEYQKLEDEILNQIERGKKIIYPFRHNEWESMVRTSYNTIYAGNDIIKSLEIMEALENKNNIKEVLNIYKNQKNYCSLSWLIRREVMEFSKNGYLFYKLTDDGIWKDSDEEFTHKIIDENTTNKTLKIGQKNKTKNS